MVTNYVDTLDYLLKLKSEKKKKDPSKIERDQFFAAWVKLAENEGFSERAERYLYNGLSYCGAKPFKQYLDQLENKEQGLQAFFTGKMYGNNAETTFRLLANLFALLLNDKKTAPLVAAVIVRFPRACFNKDKKRLGNIEDILLKYFFAELAPNTELIPLAEISVKKPVFITDFIAAMEISLDKIDTNNLSKNKVSNIAKVRKWILEYQPRIVTEENPLEVSKEKTGGTISNDSPAEVVAPAVSASTADLPTASVVAAAELVVQEQQQKNEKKDAMPPASAEERPADITSYLIDLLSKAGKAAAAVKAEGIQQKIKAEALLSELESEQEKLQRANQRIAEQQDTIADLRKKLAAAEGDIFVLKQDVALRDAMIAERETEIAERIKMADVLSRDRSKQADESLQRLASKIRVEYRDFADALDVPMSCDLGENLRLQLQSIFDILEKGGMKIK